MEVIICPINSHVRRPSYEHFRVPLQWVRNDSSPFHNIESRHYSFYCLLHCPRGPRLCRDHVPYGSNEIHKSGGSEPGASGTSTKSGEMAVGTVVRWRGHRNGSKKRVNEIRICSRYVT